MLITPADQWFSRCVRERANWTCERCHHVYTYPAQGLDCAHYETRDEWATRFYPHGSFALCRGCHGYFDRERRFEFEDFYISIFGEEELEKLRIRVRHQTDIGKFYKHTKGVGEISKYYKKKWEAMNGLRSIGISGRIEFAEWDNPELREMLERLKKEYEAMG